MIIECAHCHAKYHYDEARFEGKPAKKIRCAKCQEVFEIRNPGAAFASAAPTSQSSAVPASKPAPPRPSPPPQPASKQSDQEHFDNTMARKAAENAAEVLSEKVRRPVVSVPASPDLTPKLPEGRRLSLAIIDGPDAGKVYRIEKPRVVIGRMGADLVLNDTETSRAHAAVEIRETQMLLQDLGSTNGTLVDGSKILGQVELFNQGEFQIGSTTLMMIVTEEA